MIVTALVALSLQCSVNRIATPAELVRGADQILVVKATKFTADEKESELKGRVTFQVIEVLKGPKLDELTVAGFVEPYDGPNDAKPPYTFVRPGGRHGMCYAWDYKIGARFLLFLKKGSPYWAPLAATNEEVSEKKDDAWVMWVRGKLAR